MRLSLNEVASLNPCRGETIEAWALPIQRSSVSLCERVQSEVIMQSANSRYSGILILALGVATIGMTPPAATAAEIKIGAPLALTGSLADEAKKQELVWKMWLAKVNSAGGIN